ncbi:uncharacterized protein LOC112687425 [Sipha flava]|uniref:Uncharacterized protein LOC112687425 n=1 Tax=Sipha flava TaxID=143950 RepID=A0A8B8FYN2_9HEMI|nr:uncharacterized protein LOC112687425 [Sipha flava]
MKSDSTLVFLFLMHHEILCIGHYPGTLINASFSKKHLKSAEFYKNIYTGVKNEEINKPEYITSMNYMRKSNKQRENKSNAALLWDKKNCLPKSTALFPVPSDCRKYIRCNKGQGSVNSCAEGTLFNPNSLKCDSPDKVQCLNRNSSVFESLFPNKSSSPNFDLNTQFTNRYQFQSTDKYQPQSSKPLPGTQFIVDLQKPKVINFTDYSASVLNINYNLPVGGNKPLVGSNIVVNQPVDKFIYQYRLRPTNPLPGTQFIVDLQKPKVINFTDYSDSVVKINYSSPVGSNKPVGSNIIVGHQSTKIST